MTIKQLPEVIKCIEHLHMVAAMEAKSLSMGIGSIRDNDELMKAEKDLAKAQHERDCLSVAIQTLKGLD